MPQLTDQQARTRALSTQESFIVQAPAGSGKTELLTQRFLALLAVAPTPESILAITFTRKAAQEMRERLMQKMRLAAEGYRPQSPHEASTQQLAHEALRRDHACQWGILDNPARLRIQTIDSFCAELTRSLPITSELGAIADITEDAMQYYEAAVAALFEDRQTENHTQNLKTLLQHLDNNLSNVQTLLVSMLATRDQWLSHLLLGEEDLAQQFSRALTDINETCLQCLESNLSHAQEAKLTTLLDYVSQHHPALAAVYPAKKRKPYWQAIHQLFFTKDGDWRKRLTKQEGFPSQSTAKNKIHAQEMKGLFHDLVADFEENPSFKAALLAVPQLPPITYEKSQWQVVHALSTLLPLAVAKLRLLFYEAQQVDFTEISLAALNALGQYEQPSDLALALDYQLQHILIDEFQDTSTLQLKLLQQLTQAWQPDEGKTLFLVGDPMQSIYRFRHADVGIFGQVMQQGIHAIKPTYLTLDSNFRSQAGLVEWFNLCFSTIFPAISNYALGAVRYSPATAIQPILSDTITCYVAEDRQTEAMLVVEKIQTLIKAHPTERIAILVRARTHLRALFTELHRHHLAFNAIEIEPLSTKPWILDLLALVRALLQPTDRTAWLSLLRAPFCGLDLKSLHRIANHRTQETLWARLQNEAVTGELHPDMQARLLHLKSALNTALAHRHQCELSAILQQLWQQLNAAHAYPKVAQNDIDVFFRLLVALETQTPLLNEMHLQQALNRHFADSQVNTNLSIMTIHKAKGLEFDTVILPAMDKRPSNTDKPLLHFIEHAHDNQIDLLLAPLPAIEETNATTYEYLHHLHQQKDKLENRRLLYVAVTRAKKRLIFSATRRENNAASADSFLDYLQPFLQDHLTTATALPVPDTIKEKRLYRFPQQYFQSPPPEEQQLATDRFHFTQHPSLSATLGDLIHLGLQRLAARDKNTSIESILISLRPFWQAQLNSLGLHREKIKKSLLRIEEALHNTLNDPQGRWLLAQKTQAQSEFSLSQLSGMTPNTWIIDRTFVADGIRWIIDYKTAIPHPEEAITAFTAAQQQLHQAQLSAYKTALKSYYPDKPIKTALYFPLIPLWLEVTC